MDKPFLPGPSLSNLLLHRTASAMVAALERPSLRFATRRIVTRLFARLSFIPYLAGDDIPGFARRLLDEMARKQARGEVSPQYLRGWVTALLAQALRSPSRRRASAGRTGQQPPAFAIVSPSAACNLRCSHCYAATGIIPAHALSFDQVDRMAGALESAGTSLFLLSGGEPLLWRDQGRKLFDLAARHPRMLFIVYSNGTLLTASVADRLAGLGNILPLLSLEGLKEETDTVRGAGTYAAVRRAMGHLRRSGVLFGISVTATPRNAATLASRELFWNLVDQAGASFIWVLDLAPLGRAEEAAMLSLESRDRLQGALNREVDRGRLVVSFLHTRLSPTGCFGARRFDGFVYLDWEGDIHRCVYQPQTLLQAGSRLESREAAETLVADCAGLAACPLEREAEQPGPGTREEWRVR